MAADGPSNGTSGEPRRNMPRNQTTPIHDSNHVTARSASGRRLSPTLDARKPLVNHARIDESCLQQGYNEVAILLPERTELGNTKIAILLPERTELGNTKIA